MNLVSLIRYDILTSFSHTVREFGERIVCLKNSIPLSHTALTPSTLLHCAPLPFLEL